MNQLKEMLILQDKMNTKVDPNWKETKNPFLRAVAVEGVEGLESLGWKWWKKQVPDMQNVRMELIDIWHFILSEAIIQHGDQASKFLSSLDCRLVLIPNPYHKECYWPLTQEKVTAQERIELLIGLSALRAPLGQIVSVFRACQEIDAKMSDYELYRGYVSKNVLNFFRQDHGYKEGTYHKMWWGEEDNVWLEKIANEVLVLDADNLYKALAAKYQEYVDSVTKEVGIA